MVIGSTFFIKVFKDEDQSLVFFRQRPFETTFFYKIKWIIVFLYIIIFIKLILQKINVEFFLSFSGSWFPFFFKSDSNEIILTLVVIGFGEQTQNFP